MARGTIVLLLLAVLGATAHAQPAAQVYAAAHQLHADAQAHERACPDAACKAQQKPLYEAAARAYADYLARFATGAAATEARYYRADILFYKLDQFAAAGDLYLAVGTSQPVGKLHRDALVNAVAAYEHGRTPGPNASPSDARLREAVDVYATTFAGGPDFVKLVYAVAQLDLDRERLPEAVRGFTAIVQKFPAAPEAGPAGDRLLVALDRKKDYAAMWAAIAVLAKLPAFAAADQQARLAAVRAQASAKAAEMAADAGRFAQAGELFARAADETPRDAPAMLMNAAVMFEKAHRPDRAADEYRRVAELSPELAPRALFSLALIDEWLAQWGPAADVYERIATMFPEDPQAADALYNAGLLRRALGQRDHAIALLARYAQLFRGRKDASAVELAVADLREEGGDHAAALAAYVAVAHDHAGEPLAVDALLGAARAAFALGDDAKATENLDAIAKRARPERDKHALAEARLVRGRLVARAADRVSLAVPPAQLARALATKGKGWSEADRIFLEVAALDDVTWTIAALREGAAMRERAAIAVAGLASPPGLTAAEVATYRRLLDQFAAGMRTQAIERYGAAYAKAIALQFYGADTLAIRDALVRLGALPPDPSGPAELREDSFAPAYLYELARRRPR